MAERPRSHADEVSHFSCSLFLPLKECSLIALLPTLLHMRPDCGCRFFFLSLAVHPFAGALLIPCMLFFSPCMW